MIHASGRQKDTSGASKHSVDLNRGGTHLRDTADYLNGCIMFVLAVGSNELCFALVKCDRTVCVCVKGFWDGSRTEEDVGEDNAPFCLITFRLPFTAAQSAFIHCLQMGMPTLGTAGNSKLDVKRAEGDICWKVWLEGPFGGV